MASLPAFKVEAPKAGRLRVSSAGSARQACRIALEELEDGAPIAGIGTTHAHLSELLEAFALVGDRVPHLVAVEPIFDRHDGAWDGYEWRLTFGQGERALLLELSSCAPITAAVPLELPFEPVEPRGQHAR